MARTYTKVNWQDGTVLQPAKVTIDGTDYNVDPAIESGTTPVNATNLEKMDTAISNAVTDINNLETDKIENAAIELLEVTDTAPEHCSEGDMYYNTTTNLIYTATGTDTWGSTGELPSSDYLYIDLANQQLYYYDGTNFNSYGGGGGSTEVYIQDTEPTEEDAKIWIDTGEIAQAHTEITNEYSTSTGLGYSANYVNTKLLNVLGDRKGTYTFSLEGHVSGGGRFVNVYIPFINLNYNTDTYTITVTAIYQNGAIKSASGTIDSITKYLDGVSVSYNTDETLSNLYNCSINITLVVS